MQNKVALRQSHIAVSCEFERKFHKVIMLFLFANSKTV